MTTRQLLLAALAGALTLFSWEALSNTVLPWHARTMRSFADSSAVVQVIQSNARGNGVYVDPRGVIAAVSFAPDMSSRDTLLGLMLGRQLLLNLALAFIVLLVFRRLPPASTRQYALGTAAMAFAVSASILVSNWNWYGFSVSWTVVNTIDRTIGYGLLGLVLGALVSKASGRSTTDEWNGVRTSSGMPSTMSVPRSSTRV